MRRLFLLVVLIASLAAVALPSSASAAWCSGTRIEHLPIGSSDNRLPYGYTVAHLDVYWNGSTGKNCAMVVGYGQYYGRLLGAGVGLRSCGETRPSRSCTTRYEDHDYGQFHYYAGPVYVEARRRCIYAYGQATVPLRTYSRSDPRYATYWTDFPKVFDGMRALHCG